MFSRTHNVRADLKALAETLNKRTLEKSGWPELLVGLDFNVAPMSACIGQKAGDELHIFDEIELFNSDTAELAQEIKRRYPGRRIVAYPDPTATARKTSAPVGQTAFAILKAAGFRVVAPQAPYAVADKVNNVNALLW
jgi:hypothetical protein